MEKRQSVHLICNAHLDPVWLWRWEEGAAEAISTFRVAVEFCEKNEGFVFNHNEAVLYEWIEEYEPKLFQRIQKLVRLGKWRIMGGWYIQPDCNLPSGEAFVRQILLGRVYFKKKFGIVPKVAINFDSFGHSRGLPQILAKSGFEAYIFCRPIPKLQKLPDNYFRWVGFDGSEVVGCRAGDYYVSLRGTARKKIEDNLKLNNERPVHFVLWGIGNHGGGPSLIDLEDVNHLISDRSDISILHSSAEAFFKDFKKVGHDLPEFKGDLNPFAVGCYTSMIRMKQKYRQLENELFLTEKMITTAASQNLTEYPRNELKQVQKDLAFVQFHDILPGSMIKSAENDTLRRIDHGLEILSRIKTRAFFALAEGQEKSSDGTIPIFVYNPFPFKISIAVECEFQLPDQNYKQTFTDFVVYHEGKIVPAQIEKEESNLPIDWRKRIVIRATMEPGSMNRFVCKPNVIPRKVEPQLMPNKNGMICFKNEVMEVHISAKTGYIKRYKVGGIDVLSSNAMSLLAINDYEDPWGMLKKKYRKIKGRFQRMGLFENAKLAGVTHIKSKLRPVRVIEDGPVRTVVEAFLGYDESRAVVHYILPKVGTEFGIALKILWNQKDTMLKLSFKMKNQTNNELLSQVAYGCQSQPTDGQEIVCQKWLAVVDRKNDLALSTINDGTYAADFYRSELRLNLLRSPAYSAHPHEDDRLMVLTDRFTPRMDQGEHHFNFFVNAGRVYDRLNRIDRESLIHNEKPFALSFFPSGDGKKPFNGIKLSDNIVQITAVKMAENNNDLIIRLFEPTGSPRKTTLSVPGIGLKADISLRGFEIKTLRVQKNTQDIYEVDLMENKVQYLVGKK